MLPKFNRWTFEITMHSVQTAKSAMVSHWRIGQRSGHWYVVRRMHTHQHTHIHTYTDTHTGFMFVSEACCDYIAMARILQSQVVTLSDKRNS